MQEITTDTSTPAGNKTTIFPNENRNWLIYIVVFLMGVMLVLASWGGGYYFGKQSTVNSSKMENKIIPDGYTSPMPRPTTIYDAWGSFAPINQFLTSGDASMKTYRDNANGFSFQYPEKMIFDESTLILKGDYIADGKIVIENTQQSVLDSAALENIVKNIGTYTVNNHNSFLLIGAKRRNSGIADQYISFEFKQPKEYMYLTFVFGKNPPTVEQLAIFFKIASSFIFFKSDIEATDSKKIIQIPIAAKPVIYLYPKIIQEVSVTLDYDEPLTQIDPPFNVLPNTWRIIAHPDGILTDFFSNKKYTYLFWEGENATGKYDFNSGFVVKGSDSEKFLREILERIGLLPDEYNEFISYWVPKMKNNPYNLIHFATNEYTEKAKLTIVPKPDSLLRVFMVFKSISTPIIVKPQEFPLFKRDGFTVVEWGGTQI